MILCLFSLQNFTNQCEPYVKQIFLKQRLGHISVCRLRLFWQFYTWIDWHIFQPYLYRNVCVNITCKVHLAGAWFRAQNLELDNISGILSLEKTDHHLTAVFKGYHLFMQRWGLLKFHSLARSMIGSQLVKLLCRSCIGNKLSRFHSCIGNKLSRFHSVIFPVPFYVDLCYRGISWGWASHSCSFQFNQLLIFVTTVHVRPLQKKFICWGVRQKPLI